VKTWQRWTAFAAALVVCLGTAYGAYTLATYSWNQVVDYRGPYAKVKLPAGAEAPARPLEIKKTQGEPRLVYVIIDGLREDVSRKMPALNGLRRGGADFVVRTSQPSLSFPNWTTLMSGAPQRISGVTTNWYEERVKVETLVDVALAASRTVAVSAPKDFEMLYGVNRTGHVFLRDWTEGEYMTGEIVDHAIALASGGAPLPAGARTLTATVDMSLLPTLVVVHFPDVDEAGHAFGGASKQYLDTALKVDADLGRLVTALKDSHTTFVVTSDHGHIDTGGHGGWEDVATKVPAVFAGPDVIPGSGEGTQDQVAPTVALLNDLPAPRNATGAPLLQSPPSLNAIDVPDRFETQRTAAFNAYTGAVSGTPGNGTTAARARIAFDQATDARLAAERSARLPLAAGVAIVALLAIVAVGLLSRRVLVSALAGTLGYYLVYNGIYFGLHRYGLWSLSEFNSEALLKGFMNARMIEAVIAGVIGVLIAADVYLATHKEPRRAKGEYLPAWLALGVASVMVIEATLAMQVAWYLWQWGASVSWYIPDLMWGFKYDIDLIQMTALGAAALLAPLLAFLVGRYHPIRQPKESEAAADPA
jgi:hypothetical protein